MPIINGGGTGGLMYGNYLNNAMAQEITFQTDSHNAEFERATVYSNFIPREGSNVFRGSFLSRYAGKGWQATNLDDEQIARGLRTGNLINRIWDVNPAAGGPIIRDRLWVYASYRHWGTYNTVAGAFDPTDFSAFFYEPSERQSLFPVWHQSAVARFTTQINQRNKLNVYYDWQYTYFGNCFVPTYLTAVSACPEYKNIPQYIVQGSWSSPVTNKLLLEAGGTITPQDFHGYRRPGVSATQFAVNDPLAPAGISDLVGGVGHRLRLQPQRPDELPRVGLVRHRFARGQGGLHAAARVALQHAGAEQLGHAVAAQPAAVLDHAVCDAAPVPRDLRYNMGLYAQDQWTHPPPDDELRRTAGLPERALRPARHSGRAVHAGAALRRHRERAELERRRSAVRHLRTTCSATGERRSR